MDARGIIRSFILASFLVDAVEDEVSFLESGVVDSLGLAQLVTFLEEEFEISIRDEELVPENLDSVARAAAFVERKLSRSAA